MPVNLQEESLLNYQFKNAHGGIYGFFQSFERSDGIVIVNYQLSPRYHNAWMNQHFPNADLLMIGSMIVFILLIFIILTFSYYLQNASTLANTSATSVSTFSKVFLSLTSTIPSPAFLPTTTCNGIPIKSASLNLTPARSALSS